MFNLNTLLDSSKTHWTVLNGAAINDSGWIAGEGFYSVNDNGMGVLHPILLIPVPEPGSLVLLAIGASAIVLQNLLRRGEKNRLRNIDGVAKVPQFDGDEMGYLLGKVAEIKRHK